MMNSREVYVVTLPKSSGGNAFHQNLMDLKEDISRKLRQRGVEIADDFHGDPKPALLLVMKSTGRIGDELPSAIQDLDSSLRDKPTFFAAIQDDEYTSVGRSAMPEHFEPEILLDFVVVPGKSRLKDCSKNDEALHRIVQRMGVKVHCPCPCPYPHCMKLLALFVILVVLVVVLTLMFTVFKEKM